MARVPNMQRACRNSLFKCLNTNDALAGAPKFMA
jgi:hypothetical protein